MCKADGKIDAAIRAYAADEAELKAATDLLSTIQRMNLDEMTSTLAEAKVRVDALEKSKKSFNDGVKYYQQDNFLQAHSCFGEVVDEDKKHKEAEKLMQNCMSKYSSVILDNVENI